MLKTLWGEKTHEQNQIEPRITRNTSKCATGIGGLDEITHGGLPASRPTLLCGGTGSGKTIMALEFLLRGITKFNDNGIFLSFDESKDELFKIGFSLGFDMDKIHSEKRILISNLNFDAKGMLEIGEYDLGGLLTLIERGIEAVNAKRVVLDGIEKLFLFFTNEKIIRKGLNELFQQLKGKNVTTIITSARGATPGTITQYGIEKYTSDCIIILNHRIDQNIATRRLHIKKYQGSQHGTNEYPFLITEKGITFTLTTSMVLNHDASSERVSTGSKDLDKMFKGGYYKGSSILIGGTSGAGKSSFATHFAKAFCDRGEKCVYFSFEESPKQIVRNMRSIGLDLRPFIDKGLLEIHAARPMLQGFEWQLLAIHDIVDRSKPSAVVIDPIKNIDAIRNALDIKLIFINTMDFLKQNGITAINTARINAETTGAGITSIMDTWISLQHFQGNEQQERSLQIVKSRGIGHTLKSHSFQFSNDGIAINMS